MILRTVVILLAAAIGGFGAELAGMLAVSMPTETLGWWVIGAGVVWAGGIISAVALAFYRAGRADGLAASPANIRRP